jgi:hypothetical protein
MSSKGYCNLSATIFLIVGLVHVARVAAGFDFRIASWDLPRAASAIAAVIALGLAWWGYSSARAAKPVA